MKTIILALMFVLGSNAFAGGRHLYCEGKLVRMDVLAKGPIPMGNDLALIITDAPHDLIPLQQISETEDGSSFDFSRTYQGYGLHGSVFAILKYADGKHTFSVFVEGKPLEEIECTLGF